MTTDEIIARWRAGETIETIGLAAGTSKQAVSRRLIRAGFSPRERLYEQRAADGSSASADRLEKLTERAEQRDAAAARLAELAAIYDQTPRSLAALVNSKAGRDSETAARIRQACAPFSVDYLAHVTPSG